MKRLFPLAIILVLCFTSCSTISTEEEAALYEENTIEAVSLVLSDNEQALLDIINNHREDLGLGRLEFNAAIYEVAEEHNLYMITNDALSHNNFNERASKVAKKTKAIKVGENVARKYNDVVSAFDGWMLSDSHKKTIEGDYTHTTISITKSNTGDLYYTQIFYKE